MALMYTTTPVTIPLNGNSVTIEAPGNGMVLRSVETPADILQNCSLTFKATASNAGGATPLDVMDGGSKYSQPIGPSQFVPISKPALFGGVKRLTIIHNISGAATNVVTADKPLLLGWSQE